MKDDKMNDDDVKFPTTVAFWYKLPGWADWAQSEFTSPSVNRAFEMQREHWDNLKSLGYDLSARP